MAENKKAFVLYCDLIHTVRKMPKEKIAELFMTILSYVNDEDPVVDDLIVDLVFEPIKHQLKRDLNKWEDFRQKQSKNGKMGGRPKNPNNPSLLTESQKSLTVTVTDTVTDTDTGKVIGIDKVIIENSMGDKSPPKINFNERQILFFNELATFVSIYDKIMIRKFYDYWREPNKSKNKMKWEQEKTWDTNLRLKRWEQNQFKHETNKRNNAGNNEADKESRNSAYAAGF